MDFQASTTRARLQDASAIQGFSLEEDKAAALLCYLSEFHKWNRAYNLSAIRDPEQMYSKHLIDSLSVCVPLEQHWARHIVDVGTGGGLPGIPLAICFPDRHFTLLDSAGKKTRFLLQCVHTLGLDNVSVVNSRAEAHQPPHPADIVISRAFATLADMISCSKHLLSPEGQFWAMKGVRPTQEISDLSAPYYVESCLPLTLAEDIGERCLVIIETQNNQQR